MPDSQETTATIQFGTVELDEGNEPTFFDFRSEIERVVSPEWQTTRYHKNWRFSRPHEIKGRYLAGKLGFTRPAEEQEVHFDEEKQDYVESSHESEEGAYSHYVLDVESRRIVFQLVPQDIRPTTFTSNFEALAGEAGVALSVELLRKEISFRAWVEHIDSLAEFKAKLRPPNPRWRERTDLIRTLIEGTNADEVDVKAKVDNPDEKSLQSEGSVIEESATHSSAGYGEIEAEGVVGDRAVEFEKDHVPRRAEISVREDESSESILSRMVTLLEELVL